MLIEIIGENCVGKSTLSNKINDKLNAKIYSGKDYLRLEKNPSMALEKFKTILKEELSKITNLRLFHNHMMIEPVIDIFGYFKGDTILKLREIIFDDFANGDYYGMIHTLMWAFDMESDWEYVENLVSKFDEVYCVELIASQKVRFERNKTENRLINKASKRDIEASNERVLIEDLHRLISNEDEIPFKNYLRINNENIEAKEVAKIIKETFNL